MNSKSVHNVFKGLNTQVKASLFYFLTNLENADFDRIILEDPKWEDFTLIFKSGKRVICECKDWNAPLLWRDLKTILDKILKKSDNLTKQDCVEIVCSNLSQEICERRDSFQYGYPSLLSLLRDKGFEEEHITLLKRTSFFVIPDEEGFLEENSLALFYRHINYWLPVKEIETLVDSILVKGFYENSSKGEIFTRKRFFEIVNDYAEHKIENSVTYDREKRGLERQISGLLVSVGSGDAMDSLKGDKLSAITAQPDLMFLLLDQFKKKEALQLVRWEFLWDALIERSYAYDVLKIFENNISDKSNREFIVSFLAESYSKIVRFVRDNYIHVLVLELCKKILNEDLDQKEAIWSFLKGLLDSRAGIYGNLKKDRLSQVKDVIPEVFDILFDEMNAKEMVSVIFKSFSLIDDQGTFSIYTPLEIFKILLRYINLDFGTNFKFCVDLVVSQFKSTYVKKVSRLKKGARKHYFEGYEHEGLTMMRSNGKAYVSDLHIVRYVLEPAIKKFYGQESDSCWSFVKEYCVQSKVVRKRVSTNKPDFLNRAVLKILLEKYFNGNALDSDFSFKVLSDFVVCKRGVHSKGDLIFQALLNQSYDRTKVFSLLKVAVKEDSFPRNPFVKDLIIEFCAHSRSEIQLWAQSVIRRWFGDLKFLRLGFLVTEEISSALEVLIEQESTREFGYDLLSELVGKDDAFLNHDEWLDITKFGQVLNLLLRVDFNRWLECVTAIFENKSGISVSKQLLVTGSFLNVEDDKNNKKVLIKIYEDFLGPWLEKMEFKNSLIVDSLTEEEARVNLVKFGLLLAKNKEIEKSFKIVECFFEDPSPFMPCDMNVDYNEHQGILENKGSIIITSVRGYCLWTLQYLLVLDGRDPQMLRSILGYLRICVSADEKNYYIKHMLCFPLSRLVKLRFVDIGDGETLFFNDNFGKALSFSEEVKELAFQHLEVVSKYPDTVKQQLIPGLLMVFDSMRELDQSEAKKLISSLMKFPCECIGRSAPLLIYYAYFRDKNNLFKDWKWGGESNTDLFNFDSSWFVMELKKVLVKEDLEIREKFAWQFFLLTTNKKDITDDEYEVNFKIAFENLDILLQKYDGKVHSIIFRFIEKNFQYKPSKCWELFSRWLDSVPRGLEGIGYQQYDKLFLLIKELCGDEVFLQTLDRFIDKSEKKLWINLDATVEILKTFPIGTKEVEHLSRKLIDLKPSNYFSLKDWLKG